MGNVLRLLPDIGTDPINSRVIRLLRVPQLAPDQARLAVVQRTDTTTTGLHVPRIAL